MKKKRYFAFIEWCKDNVGNCDKDKQNSEKKLESLTKCENQNVIERELRKMKMVINKRMEWK